MRYLVLFALMILTSCGGGSGPINIPAPPDGTPVGMDNRETGASVWTFVRLRNSSGEKINILAWNDATQQYEMMIAGKNKTDIIESLPLLATPGRPENIRVQYLEQGGGGLFDLYPGDTYLEIDDITSDGF